MNEKRAQPDYSRPASLNEVERKREVDRMNFENNLMLERLNQIAPTLSNEKLEGDFKKHLHAEANLRKRQMKPLALPKDMMHRTSVKDQTSLFDASTYASQRSSFGGGDIMGGSSLLESETDPPIKSMKEFRQHVIASKKLSNVGASIVNSPNGISSQELVGVNALLKSQREISVHRNESLFELNYEPA
jgi:hypothetical protein